MQNNAAHIYGSDPGSIKNFIGGGIPAHLGAQLRDRQSTWESVRYWEMRDAFQIDLSVTTLTEIVLFRGNTQINSTSTRPGEVLTDMQEQGRIAATQAFVAVSWALYLAPVIDDAAAGEVLREADYRDEMFFRNQSFCEMVANGDNKLLSLNTHRLLFPTGATQALTTTDSIGASEGQVDPRVGHQFWLRNDAWIFPPLTTFSVNIVFNAARTWARTTGTRTIFAVLQGWRLDNVQMGLAA